MKNRRSSRGWGRGVVVLLALLLAMPAWAAKAPKKAKARARAPVPAAAAPAAAPAPAPQPAKALEPAPAPVPAKATSPEPEPVRVRALAAQPASAAPAEPAAGEPTAEVAAEAPKSSEIGLRVGLKLAMLIPAGKTSQAVTSADGEATASKTVFASGALSLQYAFPFLDRALALGVEGGYYRLAGSGTREFANDPDYGPTLAYHWKMHAAPILVGLSYQLPIPLPLVKFAPHVGFAAVYVNSQTTYRSGSGVETADQPQSAWALGFWLGLEGAIALGPGSILVEVRYLNARTDLGFNQIYDGAYNAQPGDVQGTNLLVGYRLEL